MAEPRIPSLAIHFTEEEIASAQSDLAAILRSGRLILGPYTEAFEEHVETLAGTRYAVATSSGTSALEIIFRSLDVRGRTVLVPTNTNYATAAAAVNAGATVQLYDNDIYADTSAIGSKLTAGVAAVVVVHIGGYLGPELPDLVTLCARAGVPLIEDAAHAHGAELHGRPAGSWGHAAAFSFYPTKVVTSGEGGAITTNDPDLVTAARQLRDQGKSIDGRHHVRWGNSWRITEIGAALASIQLQGLRQDTAQRRRVIAFYQQAFASTPSITVPGAHLGHGPSGYKAVAVLSDGINRDRLKELTSAHGVELGRGVYEIPLHRQPVFAGLTGEADAFPRADYFSARHICLPVWRGLTPQDQARRSFEAVAHCLQVARTPARGGPAAASDAAAG